MAAALHFAVEDAQKLEAYLPPPVRPAPPESATDRTRGTSGLPAGRPFVTLTFATSLDSSLSLAPGTPTVLSGPHSKAMTHFLRSRHDAICVGVGTAVADDPSLNCRLVSVSTPVSQPRPIVIDPHGRWEFSESSKVLLLARQGLGLAPFIITCAPNPPAAKRQLLESHGGKFIHLPRPPSHDQEAEKTSVRFRWADILQSLSEEGLRSIMIEGGGQVINSLLERPNNELVDSVIVTIAPTWLGQGGVVVSPNRTYDVAGQPTPAVRLTEALWHQLGEDVVLCGRLGR